jgi:hypothetical protein
MQKIISHILFFSFIFFNISARVNTADEKAWTVLVYIAGANDLDAFIQQNMNQLMSGGSNARVNILVYLSTHYTGQDKETRKLYVNKGSLTQHGPTESRDSGSVETFKDALEWALTDFPSEHIAVVLWDHGSGTLNSRAPMLSNKRGICYDFDTGNYLTDRDLLSAFSSTQENFRQGRKFDIVTFDACLMGSLEIAATLSSCVRYFVASEDTIPGAGYSYDRALSQFNTITPDPLSFAKRIVTAYKETYSGITDFTLSAVDLQSLDEFIENLNEVAQFLTKQLQGKNKSAAKNVIKKSINGLLCPTFNYVYVDLLQFYKNLTKYVADFKLKSAETTTFKALLSNGVALFPDFIKANVTSSSFGKAGGLTIYFDSRYIDSSYADLFWTEMDPSWLNFLKAFLAA